MFINLLRNVFMGISLIALVGCSESSERKESEACRRLYLDERFQEAVRECQRLAEGNDTAYYFLGKAKQKTGELNTEASIKWFTKTALTGSHEAQRELMNTYMELHQYEQALFWSNRYAEQHHSWSTMQSLGKLYEEGRWSAKDLVESYKWYVLGYYGNGGIDTCEKREKLAQKMTPQQVQEAMMRAERWRDQYWPNRRKIDKCHKKNSN